MGLGDYEKKTLEAIIYYGIYFSISNDLLSLAPYTENKVYFWIPIFIILCYLIYLLKTIIDSIIHRKPMWNYILFFIISILNITYKINVLEIYRKIYP